MDKYTLQELSYKNGYAKEFADGAEHASNGSKIVALSETNASLDTLKHDNEKVIINFENLLS